MVRLMFSLHLVVRGVNEVADFTGSVLLPVGQFRDVVVHPRIPA